MPDDSDDSATEDLVEPDLDDDLDEDLVEPDLDDATSTDVSDVEVVVDPIAVVAVADESDDDEEEEDEDVEASLDQILKERLVVDDDDDEDEDLDSDADLDDRSDLTERIPPKRPDEFVCRSCFLVKHPSQLADPVKVLCRDCV